MRRFLSLALTLVVLGLAACGQKSGPVFKSTDITGAPFGGEFRLTGHDGKPHALADFRGKAVVLFFGYTHCPDVCPTTMSELAGAMKQLGERAKDVQVLFVTVDPERDTQALLNQYVPSFHPAFIGLRGSPAETRAVADQFKVVYQRNMTDKTNYTVDHSAGSYIFDKTGKLRLFVSYGAGAEVFSHDLALLLAD